MRRLSILAIVAPLLLTGSGLAPAHALGGSFTIGTGVSPLDSPTEKAFRTSQCNPTVAATLMTKSAGPDALILPIGTTEQYHKLLITWSHAALIPALSAGLKAQFYRGCLPVFGYQADTLSSPWTIGVPGDASWVVITAGAGEIKVDLTISTQP
jgi:hypothetical protein